ncbi:Protein rds1 [Sphaceloma murrayae]|uniref:Protein rds1 n=1 Tax=Sphaceloma murrayae TaxID=2082308 RepID=A0A2K1QIX8_9PEZI|nr:Protein rds1 [Sphaceloma murrayae]
MKASVYSAALFAVLSAAAPLEKRQSSDIDETILNYALTLEHLEAAFYTESLAKFSASDLEKAGFKETNFYKNFKKISRDETSHVAVIQQIQASKGYSSVKACTYDFKVTTPRQFVVTSSLLEGVGTSAYLGAAAVVTDKSILTAAGSILTTEARHTAFLRNLRDQSPFAQAYDTPLGFKQVFSLAASFIVECPSDNPDLGITAFPSLTPKKASYKNLDEIVFTIGEDATIPDGDLYVAWPTVLGPIFKQATVDTSARTATVKVPGAGAAGTIGQSYAVLTTSGTSLTDDNTVAGPAVVNIASPYLTKKGSKN